MLERRRGRRERAEDEARERRELELARSVRLGTSLRRHAALAAQPLAEGDAGEVAAKIVAPIVIDADNVARFPALVEQEQRSAMRAAVLEGVQVAVLVARHHHRHRAEARAAIGVGTFQLGFQAEEIPGRPAEDAFLLLLVDRRVRIDPIGHAREPFGRPVVRLH